MARTTTKKPAPGRTLIDTFIAGVIHCDHEVSKVIPRGTVLNLEQEPMNRFDKNALALWLNGVKVGYLPKQDREGTSGLKGYQPVWFAIRQGLPIRITVLNHAPGNPSWYMIKVRVEVPKETIIMQTSQFAVPTF